MAKSKKSSNGFPFGMCDGKFDKRPVIPFGAGKKNKPAKKKKRE